MRNAELEGQQAHAHPQRGGPQVMWIRSLGWEDPLEEGVATHSSILAWRIAWTEEPGGLQSRGSHRVRIT